MKKVKADKEELSQERREELLRTLEGRFGKNMKRHKGLEWSKVKARLESRPEKLWSLDKMDETVGEPDSVGQDAKLGE